MGLMWFDPDSIQATVYDKQLRHEARQEDKLARYGWLRHDGRRYGRQELVDGDYALSIQMVGGWVGVWVHFGSVVDECTMWR
jgi:mannosyl-oligosaccharide glucosidase